MLSTTACPGCGQSGAISVARPNAERGLHTIGWIGESPADWCGRRASQNPPGFPARITRREASHHRPGVCEANRLGWLAAKLTNVSTDDDVCSAVDLVGKARPTLKQGITAALPGTYLVAPGFSCNCSAYARRQLQLGLGRCLRPRRRRRCDFHSIAKERESLFHAICLLRARRRRHQLVEHLAKAEGQMLVKQEVFS